MSGTSTATTDTTKTADTTAKTADTTSKDTTTAKTADTTTATTTTDTTKTADTTTKTADTTTTKSDDATAKPSWPEDWRTRMAKGDEKVLKRLERFASPEAVWDSFEQANKKISSGVLKQPLKENATAEEVKAWRAENGIPESPDKYDTSLGDGHVWGDADKPLLQSFTKAAHDANLAPEAVKPMLAWYKGVQDQIEEKRIGEDAQYKKDNVDKLIAEWGPSMRMEVRLADEYFDSMPKEVAALFREARGPDGRLLYANADLIRWANGQQRAINPIATVMGGGKDSLQAMEGELTALKAKMADKKSDYWVGPNAEKNQARYRELLDAQSRAGGKKAA